MRYGIEAGWPPKKKRGGREGGQDQKGTMRGGRRYAHDEAGGMRRRGRGNRKMAEPAELIEEVAFLKMPLG